MLRMGDVGVLIRKMGGGQRRALSFLPVFLTRRAQFAQDPNKSQNGTHFLFLKRFHLGNELLLFFREASFVFRRLTSQDPLGGVSKLFFDQHGS